MGCGDVKRSFSVIILRQMHVKMTPLNGVDGGIMVGSVDGYQWIPKRSGVLFCLQFGEEKKKGKHILSLAVTAFHPWCYRFMGGRERSYPRWGSNVATFSSLSIVPLLTAPKAFKGETRKGLPPAGWNETFIGAVCLPSVLRATLKVKFRICISRQFTNRSETVG